MCIYLYVYLGGGVIKRSFTWNDNWGEPLNILYIPLNGKVTHGHLGTRNTDQPLRNPLPTFIHLQQ